MKNFDKYYKVALETTKRASSFLRDSYGQTKEMTHKSGTHFGIADDVESNKIIEDYLRSHTPEVAIYSEEGERNLESKLVWIIDPIDGTSNYRVEIPMFVTQLCLLSDGEPVVSVIRAPVLDLVFSAQKNKGAFLNDEKIMVSETSEISRGMFGFNKGSNNLDVGKYITQLGPIVRTIRIYGAMGMDLAYVASGKLDALINSGSDLYNFAPGVLLVREAGGVAVNFDGKDWKSNDKTLLATNKNLVEEVLKILQNK